MSPARVGPLADLGSADLGVLVAESEQAGLTLVRKLVDEWKSGTSRFDGPGEVVLGAWLDGRLVGVCGLNVDPYVTDPRIGRVRHLYVLAASRRLGVARQIMAEIIEAARRRFDLLRLSTSNPAAACLYEALGFHPVTARDCTHVMRLAG